MKSTRAREIEIGEITTVSMRPQKEWMSHREGDCTLARIHDKNRTDRSTWKDVIRSPYFMGQVRSTERRGNRGLFGRANIQIDNLADEEAKDQFNDLIQKQRPAIIAIGCFSLIIIQRDNQRVKEMVGCRLPAEQPRLWTAPIEDSNTQSSTSLVGLPGLSSIANVQRRNLVLFYRVSVW